MFDDVSLQVADSWGDLAENVRINRFIQKVFYLVKKIRVDS